MDYLRVGIRLTFIISLGFANVSAIAADKCGDLPTATSLSASARQCRLSSNTGIKGGHLLSGIVQVADSGEHKSCVSDCEHVYSQCTTSRARDCGREYKVCSWTC